MGARDLIPPKPAASKPVAQQAVAVRMDLLLPPPLDIEETPWNWQGVSGSVYGHEKG